MTGTTKPKRPSVWSLDALLDSFRTTTLPVTDGILKWNERKGWLELYKGFATFNPTWKVEIDASFTAEAESYGDMHSRSTLPRTAVGGLTGGVTGAVIGSAWHKKADTRGSVLEIRGNDSHEVFIIEWGSSSRTPTASQPGFARPH